MKAITTTQQIIVPYNMVVQMGSTCLFYDTLGNLHNCTPSERDNFINWLFHQHS